jgi:penicillin amidase
VPGWVDDFAWQGYVPFEELPTTLNPDAGYIVTANNAVVSEAYPYRIADAWDYGYRAHRVVDLIEAGSAFTAKDFGRMQADAMNLGALDVLPALVDVELDADLTEARSLLLDWDGQQSADSQAATLFNAYWRELLAATFHDELPEQYWPGSSSRWYVVVAELQEQPESAWWDDKATVDVVESRDEILAAALAAAVDEVGSVPAAWGELHGITFEHQVISSFPLIDRLFNRGPFPVSGGASIVNATSWDLTSGSYAVTSLPSKRSIMDLSDWQNSLQINTVGQSGHPYHEHYFDLAPLWAEVENIPMQWDLDAVQADAEGLLRLVP